MERVSNDVEGAVEAGMFSLSSDLARSVTLRSGKRVGSLSPSKPRPPDGSMEAVDLVRNDEEQAHPSNLLSKAPPASGFSSGSSSVGSPLRRRRIGVKDEMLAVPGSLEEEDDVDNMQVDTKPALLGIDEEEDDDDGHSAAAPFQASTSTTRVMRTLA